MSELSTTPHYFSLEQQKDFSKMDDETNPECTFDKINSNILSMIVKGEIDPVAMAWKTLADRGLDHCGEWVGFDQAKRIFEACVVQNIRISK